MSELRQRFIDTLNLQEADIIFPRIRTICGDGAALYAEEAQQLVLCDRLANEEDGTLAPTDTLDPIQRRSRTGCFSCPPCPSGCYRKPLSEHKGAAYLYRCWINDNESRLDQ